MKSYWDMLSPFVVLLAALWLVGCATPLKEVAIGEPDAKDTMHFVVNRDLVNTRAMTQQQELNGSFHCTHMRTALEVAELRQQYPGVEFSQYKGCTPLVQHAERHHYDKTSLPPASDPIFASGKALVYSAAGVVGLRELGRGIAKSGDRITQEGGGADANATGGDAASKSGSDNVTSRTTIDNSKRAIGAGNSVK